MSQGFVVRGQGADKKGAGSNIDWAKVNEGVSEGLKAARISQIIDLGVHKDEVKLGGGESSITSFKTEDELDEFYEYCVQTYGSKHPALNPNKCEMWNDDKGWHINVNEYGGEREYQEVAIVLDFPTMICDYGEFGKKPYRALINSVYEGSLKGFQMKKSKPKKDNGIWTFAANSKMAELATATNTKEILNDEKVGINGIHLMLGKALNITVELNEAGFVKLGKAVQLMDGQVVPELPEEPVMINFPTLTVEDLEKAHLRKAVFDKWEKASDYGDIKDIVEQFQEKQKAEAASKKDKPSDDGNDESDEGESKSEKPQKVQKVEKVRKVNKTKATESNSESAGDADSSGESTGQIQGW